VLWTTARVYSPRPDSRATLGAPGPLLYDRPVKVLSISGSLRKGSSNTQVLRIAAQLAPEGLNLTAFEGLADLPHFNQDLDIDPPPQAVQDFRRTLAEAQGFVISTPEYAHGIPGSLKNALDWAVSSGEFYGKPVLLINASPGGGQWAQTALIDTLTVLDARVLTQATVIAPLARKRLAAEGAPDPELVRAVERGLAALASALRHR
jgi:chromate reductase, NAD(P)H dehydrogenase (quinone)